MPFPVNEITISIIKQVIKDNEEELDLIYAFHDKPSQTMEELKASSGLSEQDLERITSSLAKKGLLFNQPSSAGIMVYRLLPLMTVGLMEYKFMGELKGNEEERTLAELFQRLIYEMRDQVQQNPIRIIPVDRSLQPPAESVLPSQSVEEIIEKFDDIAVGHCFCRQRKMALGGSCSLNAPLENCFTFGKSARHTTAQGFARMVTKEEALKIMREAEEAGLVHKAFHPNSKVSRPETSICNCCKDCCDTLRLWREGAFPLVNSTYYLSVIDEEVCTGCGICAERCPTDAIRLNDEGKAERDEASCFGCGICARFCPEEAISLKEGWRKVMVLPPRLRTSSSE
ncbi:MAG: 4Fe-4S binding protein [Deltaproteobacteria bacterium]|nr:4Fe-4S binding protein [Deltaproteobacteria bacterium]